MAVKTAFEPKEARITFDEKYYCYDDDMKGRKRITGTQALVEFLNTTSPEEFHKTPTKRTSTTLFFKRKNDKKSTTGTIHRKSYIEIIANPFTFNRSKSTANNNNKNNVTDRTLSSNTSIYSHDQPILPTHRKSTQTQTTNRRQIPSLRVSALNPYIEKDHVNTIFNMNKQDDIIEGGLKKRLEKYQLNSIPKPSDLLSEKLAQEHLIALNVVSCMEEDINSTNKKKRGRHIQVQTMPYYPDEQLIQKEEETISLSSLDSNDLLQKLAKAEKDLKQEKILNSRLQAALEDTRDQFDVLSGLAYKKLREVWEEKMRWENACIEIKEKCWHDHQQQILGQSSNKDDDQSDILSFTTMDINEDSSDDDEEEDFI